MKGKIIFITGATSGIGEGCARKFAAMGSDLILNGRNTEKLEKLRKELTATGVKVLTPSMSATARRQAAPSDHSRGNGVRSMSWSTMRGLSSAWIRNTRALSTNGMS